MLITGERHLRLVLDEYTDQLQHSPAPPGTETESVDRAGQRSGDPQQLAGRASHDLQVHPVAVVLAGEERPVPGDPVRPDERAVQDDERVLDDNRQ
jgi:hypothetical protein